MLQNPKVTVLMSVYNGDKYLCEAIDSILNQTFKDFEFIIINDGSTDQTTEILQSYDDERIVLINNERNIGLTKSLNKGLKVSRGEYIARMDADDISLPRRLEKQLDYLEQHKEIGVVGTRSVLIDSEGKEINSQPIGKSINNDSLQEQLLTINCFIHGSVMLRRKCIETVGAYREQFRYAQDYDLWLRISELFKMANIEEVFYKSRIHSAAIREAKKKEQNESAEFAVSLAVQRRIFGKDELRYVPDGEVFEVIRDKMSKGFFTRRKNISNGYLSWSRRYFDGDWQWIPKIAFKFLLKSIISYPLNLKAWKCGFYTFGKKIRKLILNLRIRLA